MKGHQVLCGKLCQSWLSYRLFFGYTSATPTFCSYIALVKNVIAMTRSCNTDILLLLWEWIIVWYWLFFIKVAFLTLTEKIPFCSKDFQFPEKSNPAFHDQNIECSGRSTNQFNQKHIMESMTHWSLSVLQKANTFQ